MIFTSHGRSLSVVFVASFIVGIDDFHFKGKQKSNPRFGQVEDLFDGIFTRNSQIVKQLAVVSFLRSA